VQRPDQHDTDTKGQALLLSFFADVGWEVSKPKDYGRDLGIEIFWEKKTTGVLFNVQLKSARTHDTDHSGSGRRGLFWSAIQIGTALLSKLNSKPNDAGLIHSAESVYTTYPGRKRDTWTRGIVLELKTIPLSVLICKTGLSRRMIQRSGTITGDHIRGIR
jgi:hypothetical protein